MLHPCGKSLSSVIFIILGASILMRDAGAVSGRGRELEVKCTCNSPCGIPCENPSPPPPSPPEWLPPPPPPSPPPPPPLEPGSPPSPFCPPPPKQPYTPSPPYWFSPPGILYPVDPGFRADGACKSSVGWLPVFVGCGLLALWP